MDTGDVVLHKPTGEKWVVAYITTSGRHLVCCGWPESIAELADCDLVKSATPEQRFALLEQMASMTGCDSRKSYAKLRLETAESVLPKEQ